MPYPNTFRKTTRPMTALELQLHDQLKDKAEELLQLIHQVPEFRERSIAHTKLEEAVMWAIKGLTKPKPLPVRQLDTGMI